MVGAWLSSCLRGQTLTFADSWRPPLRSEPQYLAGCAAGADTVPVPVRRYSEHLASRTGTCLPYARYFPSALPSGDSDWRAVASSTVPPASGCPRWRKVGGETSHRVATPPRFLLQEGDRAGQVIAVVLMGETQHQLWLHHRNPAGVFPKGITGIPPVLAIADRAFIHLIGFSAISP